MKATLTFQLPQEGRLHTMALKGAEFCLVLQNLANHLRSRLKHADLGDEAYKELDDVRIMLHEQVPDLYDDE